MLRLTMVLAVVLILPACGGGGSSTGGGAGAFSAGVYNDPGIQSFPDEGHTHVPVGTVIQYDTDPPTSGNHYPFPQQGGYYPNPILAGYLVHSMEHGGVIIYYNPAVITADQTAALKALAQAHPGVFGQVICVPRNDPTYPFILTAWTHWLRLSTYDLSRVDNFLSLFLGQGPEDAWGAPTTSKVTVSTGFTSTAQMQVSDLSRPGSMTSNTGMVYPTEGSTFSVDIQASSASTRPDTQSVRILAPPAAVAAAEYNASTGSLVLSIGSTTFPMVPVSPGSYHTVTLKVATGGSATWAVDGTVTASVPLGNVSVSMELDVNYASGTGAGPTFFFRNPVVTNVTSDPTSGGGDPFP
ncbi:MAG TPA: DUF3105 domain-containing protein [Planctomycetota bacterium]|nr:DUF3105 domain-containing protein [Planctomycetota bacterium]